MRTALAILLLVLAVANAQTTTTVFNLDTGRIVSQETRQLGYIYIERGNQAVLQTFPAEYYRGYGSGYVHRSHRFYGRAYRGAR